MHYVARERKVNFLTINSSTLVYITIILDPETCYNFKLKAGKSKNIILFQSYLGYKIWDLLVQVGIQDDGFRTWTKYGKQPEHF